MTDEMRARTTAVTPDGKDAFEVIRVRIGMLLAPVNSVAQISEKLPARVEYLVFCGMVKAMADAYDAYTESDARAMQEIAAIARINAETLISNAQH